MVSTLAWNPRDVCMIATLGTIFPIFISPMTIVSVRSIREHTAAFVHSWLWTSLVCSNVAKCLAISAILFFKEQVWLALCLIGCGRFTSYQHLIRMSVDLWQCALMVSFSAGPLEDQATTTMIQYPTQSHYLDLEPNSSCYILIEPSARQENDKY